MKQIILGAVALSALSSLSLISLASTKAMISEQAAIEAALKTLNIEIIGIRFDKPDAQWDVFIRSGEQAFEIEINAQNGEVVAVEQERLAEIKAELSGDLSHEGVEGDIDK